LGRRVDSRRRGADMIVEVEQRFINASLLI